MKRIIVCVLLSFLYWSVGSNALAQEDLTSLLQARSESGAKTKKLRKDQVVDRQAELKRLLAEEKAQQHQQRLNKELEKLDKLITKYQLPMDAGSKWWLKNDKDIKKWRNAIAQKARSLRGLTFQLQTVHSSILESIQSEQQSLKKYLRALTLMQKLVTKQFPLKRINELMKVMKSLEGRITKQKAELKLSVEKVQKLNKQIPLTQKRLKLLRKEMFQEPTPPADRKKAKEPVKKAVKKAIKKAPRKRRRRKSRKPRPPSKAELERQERARELKQILNQLKSLEQRLQFSQLSQQVLLYTLHKRDEQLSQSKINVDIQLYLLTLSKMKSLYKFYSAQLKGGSLHHQPFSLNGALFTQVRLRTETLIKTSPQQSSLWLKQFLVKFEAQRTEWGTVWFGLLFVLLPLFILICSLVLKRWLQNWIERSQLETEENQTTKRLRRVLLLIARTTRDIVYVATGFAIFVLFINMLPLPTPGWRTLLLVSIGVFVIARTIFSLSNQLFAKQEEQRYIASLDDENAKKFRRFFKFFAIFSLAYWPTLQAITLLQYPQTFIDVFQLIFFAMILFWLLFSFFKRSTIHLIVTPPPEMKTFTRLIIYRIYPVILLNMGASFIVYIVGYRNLATYLARGLSLTVLVVSLAYAAFRIGSLVIYWAFSIEEESDGDHTLAFASGPKMLRLLHVALVALLVLIAIGLILEAWDTPKGWRGLIWLINYPILTFQKSQLSLPSFAKFFLVFGSALWLSRWLREKLTEMVYPMFGIELGTQHAINTVVGYLFLIVGLLTALQVMGMGLGVLTVFAGAIGIGVGFGLKDIASNFIAGLILIFGRPISVGDVIEVGKTRGVVRSISARSTTIETATKHTILIPNAKLVTSQVENLSKGPPFIRITTSIGVAYGSDLDLVRKTLMEIATENPKTTSNPDPAVNISEFGDNNITFNVSVSSKEYLGQGAVMNWIRNTVAERFATLGIQMAFPQTDVHLDPQVESVLVALKDHLVGSATQPTSPAAPATDTEPQPATPAETKEK